MNGKSERKNITLIELIVVIMLNFRVVSHRWRGILLTARYVFNRVVKSKNKISPYEILKKNTIKLFLIYNLGLSNLCHNSISEASQTL